MSLTAVIEALVATGATPEQLLAVVRAHEVSQRAEAETDALLEAGYRRRMADRERQALRRSTMDRPWHKLVSLVYSRDGRVCAYCGGTEDPFHIDHIIPVSRGGGSGLDNLAVACIACNLSKGSKTPDEWRKAWG